jgi:NADP-dependent 3-hydroxy acid dehydrogenase YdfG
MQMISDRSLQSISPGCVKTNIAEGCEEIQQMLEKIPTLKPDDVADALIYALGTRPEVQVRIIVESRFSCRRNI